MEEKKLTVTFVNVGYGEAILLESPDPSKPDGVFTALIDGGSAEDSEFADRSSGRVRIEEYLKKRGIRRLDLAVSTHIHEDHLCGLLLIVTTAGIHIRKTTLEELCKSVCVIVHFKCLWNIN